MDYTVISTQIAVAACLFFLVNFLGRHSRGQGYEILSRINQPEEAAGFNFVFRVVTPIVFLIVVSTFLYSLGLDHLTTNIHYSLFLYIFLRLGVNFLKGRLLLLPWGRQLAQWACILLLGFVSYREIISQKELLFPDVKTIGNEIWLGLIGYLYILANDFRSSDSKRKSRTQRHVNVYARNLSKKYETTIRKVCDADKFVALTIAVILVESFNRPRVYRLAERALFGVRKVRTVGLMQVSTSVRISDDESVWLGTKKLFTDATTLYPDARARLATCVARETNPNDVSSIIDHEEERFIRAIARCYNNSYEYAIDVSEITAFTEQSLFGKRATPLIFGSWSDLGPIE